MDDSDSAHIGFVGTTTGRGRPEHVRFISGDNLPKSGLENAFGLTFRRSEVRSNEVCSALDDDIIAR